MITKIKKNSANTNYLFVLTGTSKHTNSNDRMEMQMMAWNMQKI
jgi:hypothetical protein